MADFFDIIISLGKNPYALSGFIAFIFLVIGIALPSSTKNANGSVNDNSKTKIALISLGSVIAAVVIAVYYFMHMRKSSPVVPMYYY